jgi:thioredoxin
MKKIISTSLLVTAILMGCSSQPTPQPENQTAKITTNETVTKPVKLTKQMFLDEIVDYEKNPGQWIYKGELPGLIDFYADWCRPCRMTSPIMEELAQEYSGQIKFYKIDIQAEQELASIFGIQTIPSFLFIPMNDRPVMSSGIAATPELTKEMFRQQINEILLKKPR